MWTEEEPHLSHGVIHHPIGDRMEQFWSFYFSLEWSTVKSFYEVLLLPLCLPLKNILTQHTAVCSLALVGTTIALTPLLV